MADRKADQKAEGKAGRKAGRKAAMPEAAKRALREAEERRQSRPRRDLPAEIGGREGPEPTRFDDWERKGIASDF